MDIRIPGQSWGLPVEYICQTGALYQTSLRMQIIEYPVVKRRKAVSCVCKNMEAAFYFG
jgi:hypothetical protein